MSQEAVHAIIVKNLSKEVSDQEIKGLILQAVNEDEIIRVQRQSDTEARVILLRADICESCLVLSGMPLGQEVQTEVTIELQEVIQTQTSKIQQEYQIIENTKKIEKPKQEITDNEIISKQESKQNLSNNNITIKNETITNISMNIELKPQLKQATDEEDDTFSMGALTLNKSQSNPPVNTTENKIQQEKKEVQAQIQEPVLNQSVSQIRKPSDSEDNDMPIPFIGLSRQASVHSNDHNEGVNQFPNTQEDIPQKKTITQVIELTENKESEETKLVENLAEVKESTLKNEPLSSSPSASNQVLQTESPVKTNNPLTENNQFQYPSSKKAQKEVQSPPASSPLKDKSENLSKSGEAQAKSEHPKVILQMNNGLWTVVLGSFLIYFFLFFR